MSKISQEILDYLESPFPFKEIMINYHVTKAIAAKNGQVLCYKDDCPHYVRRDNDGYGWRECGCGMKEEHIIEYTICPYRRIDPYKYKPFENDAIGVIRPFKDEIINEVNKVYEVDYNE